jgi:hypothetical protein
LYVIAVDDDTSFDARKSSLRRLPFAFLLVPSPFQGEGQGVRFAAPASCSLALSAKQFFDGPPLIGWQVRRAHDIASQHMVVGMRVEKVGEGFGRVFGNAVIRSGHF